MLSAKYRDKVVVLVLGLATVGTSGTGVGLVVTEVMSDSLQTGDLGADWWELTNAGPTGLSLASYSWDDNRRRPGQNVFGDVVLEPNASVIILDAPPEGIPLWKRAWDLDEGIPVVGVGPWNTGFSKLSKRDGVFVYDPAGQRVTSVQYADQRSGCSLAWNTVGKPLGFTDANKPDSRRSAGSPADLASPGLAVWGRPGGLAVKLYWTDKNAGKIQRADREGGAVEDLLTSADGLVEPRGLVLDIAHGTMLWVDGVLGTIQRARLDGSGVEVLVAGLVRPRDLEVDWRRGEMYWSDRGPRAIQRANVDGTGPIEDVVCGVGEPYYLALDPVGRQLYWSDYHDTYIRRRALDSPAPIEDVVTGLDFVRDVVVDPDGRWLYWGDRGTHRIQRRRLDGTTIETLYGPKGLDRPHGLALDARTGLVYWTDTQMDAVFRGPVAGQVPFQYLATGLDGPWALALVSPSPDRDGDGAVTAKDFSWWALGWGGTPDTMADLNGDGHVDGRDLRIFCGAWLRSWP